MHAFASVPFCISGQLTRSKISPNRNGVTRRRRGLTLSSSFRRIDRLSASTNDAASVIAIGEALFGVTLIRSPTDGSLSETDMLANDYDVPREQVKSWTPKAGGAACNVAAGLAKFGVPISIISAVGRDNLGDDLIATLQSTDPMLRQSHMCPSCFEVLV